MTRKQLFAISLMLLVIVALTSAFSEQRICGILTASSRPQSGSLDPFEEQVVALVNGSRAYICDLELENIALEHPDFRVAGSIGANEAANWIKEKFDSFGLDAWLEPFEFTNWTLLSAPSLIIDVDGNQSTADDQVVIGSFQCEHYSWPTPEEGVFNDLVILPLPPADEHNQLGANPINMTEWDAIDTSGKILLIGREVRLTPNWTPTFFEKIVAQPPSALVYTWWYSWMSFTPPMHSSIGGKLFWEMEIPAGFVNYYDGLEIRDAENTSASVAANVTIRSVINTGMHYNVVGRIMGFQHPEKFVIISGHYDTVMCNGFCDNGAGTAGVIELAEVIAEAVEKELYEPSYTLLFVAFTGEELWLVGSANYVRQHKNDMANITAVINLDCIGSDDLYVTDTPNSNLYQKIVEAAQDLDLSITIEGVGGSDQESFRVPFIVNDEINFYWNIDLGIADATPVASSVMLDSYPLLYSDLWNIGEPGWIHTAYDNSTSTNAPLFWVEVDDLGDHIKVAALAIMRISPNLIPEFPSNITLALLIAITFFVCILARKRLYGILFTFKWKNQNSQC